VRLGATWVLFALAGAQGLLSQSIDESLAKFITPAHTNCGRYQKNYGSPRSPERQRTVLDCARKELSQRTPFYFIESQFGIDSTGYTGLIGAPNGEVLIFGFDSAPCGNPNRCGPSFATRPCPYPDFVQEGEWQRVRCLDSRPPESDK
jgi:hypothetical protein